MHLPSEKDIRRMRKRLGLTQTELAQRANVSQSLIARIESGSVDPRLSTLRRILEALEKSTKEQKYTTAEDVMYQEIVSIDPEDLLAHAAELMRENAVSQLPVIENGKQIGALLETSIMSEIIESPKALNKKVKEVMKEKLPSVDPKTNVKNVYELIKEGHPAVLVEKEGTILGIITKIDLISYHFKWPPVGPSQ
ncbi:MAG: CBS domain-containing protein [Promethearchaeota archaeon]